MCNTEKKHHYWRKKKEKELREFYRLDKRVPKETWDELLKICHDPHYDHTGKP